LLRASTVVSPDVYEAVAFAAGARLISTPKTWRGTPPRLAASSTATLSFAANPQTFERGIDMFLTKEEGPIRSNACYSRDSRR
jgi:hypothetical protein